MSVDVFTIDLFRSLLNQSFSLESVQSGLSLKLIQVDELTNSESLDEAQRQPFSLLFLGPEARPLSQQTYRLEHSELGVLDVFLVPVGEDRGGVQYEAVFN